MKIRDIIWVLFNMKGGMKFLWVMFKDSMAAKYQRMVYRAGPNPKQVVIVGGSYGGYTAAKQLANRLPSGWAVTIVEKLKYLNHSFVYPRYAVFDGYESSAFIPIERQKCNDVPEGSIKTVFGECVDLNLGNSKEQSVLLKDGTQLPFEYLVIATGTTMSLPISREYDSVEDGVTALKTEQTNIADASDIAVIGAGAVGIELATDIKYKYGDKKRVVLFCSRDHVLPRFPSSVSEQSIEVMKELGVELRMKCRPTFEGNTIFVDGKPEKFDLVYSCVGGHANTKPFVGALGESVIDPKSGVISTRDTLQVDSEGHENVFAIGDVQTRGPDMARAAMPQSRILASNIVDLIRNRPVSSHYEPQEIENALKLTLGLNKSLLSMQESSRVTEHEENYLMGCDQTWSFFDVEYNHGK